MAIYTYMRVMAQGGTHLTCVAPTWRAGRENGRIAHTDTRTQSHTTHSLTMGGRRRRLEIWFQGFALRE